MAEHNLDQCLAEIQREADAAEKQEIKLIQKGAMATLRSMIFTLSPVRSGLYRASLDLMVNGVSKFRRRPRKKPKGVPWKVWHQQTQRMLPQAQEQMAKAAKRLQAITSIKGLTNISIASHVPHVHFVEGGGSKKAPQGVFDVARQQANMEFGKMSVEGK